MARQPRKYSDSGIYHVILRGINREKIFCEDVEKEKFLHILSRNFAGGQTPEIGKHQGRLFAFCILDNHVHLLIKESSLGISNLMQRIGTAYANFFNRRHGRSGPVFESRYTSRAVEGKHYFSNVLKYIHNNPVQARIVKQACNYYWSSMYFYLNKSVDFLMRDFVVGNLSNEDFEEAMALPYFDDNLLKCNWPTRIADMAIITIINNICKTYGILRENISHHTACLITAVKKLSPIEGITKSQIARLLGIRQYELSRIIISL